MPSYQQRVAWVATEEEYHLLRPRLGDDEEAWKVLWDLYLDRPRPGFLAPDARQIAVDIEISYALEGEAMGHTCPPHAEWAGCDECVMARYEERLRALEPGLETA